VSKRKAIIIERAVQSGRLKLAPGYTVSSEGTLKRPQARVITNLSEELRGAESAIKHGRYATARRKLQKVLAAIGGGFSRRESATLLAALRLWQARLRETPRQNPAIRVSLEELIALDAIAEDHPEDGLPLNTEEVDALIERENIG
jgi:hypothetical protein